MLTFSNKQQASNSKYSDDSSAKLSVQRKTLGFNYVHHVLWPQFADGQKGAKPVTPTKARPP